MLEAKDGQELRRDPRVTLAREVLCQGEAEHLQSRFADISKGGMFLDTTRQPFPPGARVTVTFLLAPMEPLVKASAEVTYVQDRLGMGLKFVEIEPEDLARIEHFVDAVLAQRLPPSELHTRKSSRVSISIIVNLEGDGPDGAHFEEQTSIITLSKHGACLLTSHPLDPGARVSLTTANGLEFRGSVVWVGSAVSRSDGQIGIQSRGLAQALGFEFP